MIKRNNTQISRRELLKQSAMASAAIIAAPMINRRRFRLFANVATEYSTRAIDLMKRATVIDMLSPFLIGSRGNKWFSNPDTFTAADLQGYKDSGINVFHIAVGTGGRDAYLGTLRFVSLWDGFIANHDQTLMRVDSVADLERVKSSGKVGVLIGVQNSEHFQSVDDVNFFHGLGQRVSQLTYNTRNLIGNGSTERRDESG